MVREPGAQRAFGGTGDRGRVGETQFLGRHLLRLGLGCQLPSLREATESAARCLQRLYLAFEYFAGLVWIRIIDYRVQGHTQKRFTCGDIAD